MEKGKLKLVRLFNQSLAFDDLIEATKKNLEELEAIQKQANSGKFKLK